MALGTFQERLPIAPDNQCFAPCELLRPEPLAPCLERNGHGHRFPQRFVAVHDGAVFAMTGAVTVIPESAGTLESLTGFDERLAREIVEAGKLRVDRWRDKEATRGAVHVTIRDFLWSDETGLPAGGYSDEEVEARSDDVFRHVFHAYPTVP